MPIFNGRFGPEGTAAARTSNKVLWETVIYFQDEFSMAEIQPAMYLRRRFALVCDRTQADKNRQVRESRDLTW